MINHASFWGGAAAPYEIEQSLRFNYSGQVLSRTPSADGNKDKFTWSGWVKRTKLGRQVWLFAAGGSSNPREGLNFDGSDQFDVASNTGTTPIYNITSTARYRDPSAWYHVMYVYDSAQATASNRIKLYINGSQITDLVNSTYPSQNGDAQFINGTSQHTVGGIPDNNGLLDAYLAEVIFADGQALSPTDFGEYDNKGVWRPIDPSGITFGTQGYYLKFDPSATNGIGHDHSGNGNNFTANNFTTSGTGTDVMSDTPTNNWCTWNPLDSKRDDGSYNYPSNGNLFTRVNSAGNYSAYATNIGFLTAGKWYFEYVPVRGGNNNNTNPGHKLITKAFVDSSSDPTGLNMNCGTQDGDGGTYMVAIDMDNGYVYRGRNGTWSNSGDPTSGSSGTGSVASFTAGTPYRLAIYHRYDTGSSEATHNFGQRAFAYTVPTGYSTLNTSNMPTPDIADGSDYFNTVLYTGTGSARSITGVGFQPDLVWFKIRSSADSHALYDAVRGVQERLQADSTAAEGTQTQALSAFDSDGWSMGTDSQINGSSSTYVAWNWKANGSTSSNTDGSITSTVSANPTAGFSIVSYTGNNTAGATVGHGLGVAPAFIITKNRDNSSAYWATYHQSLGTSKKLYLNDTQAPDDASGWLSVSSSVITWNQTNANNVNVNGDDFICYCFAEVEGYSKFGSYTGNGSSDGPFLYCGFRPKFVCFKRTDSAGAWFIEDSVRGTYNVMGPELYANNNEAEATSSRLDFLSNGFKLRAGNSGDNASGGTYIFMAFAENPFGGSGVSPATAR
jgi:hypothetical protein